MVLRAVSARRRAFQRCARWGMSACIVTGQKGTTMSAPRTGGNSTGIGLGGILVIVGIIVAIAWSLWIGIIIALIGLIAFGGFARGKWY